MRERNFYSSTFSRYRKNIQQTLLKGILFYLLFFLIAYGLLKIFTVTINQNVFLYLFLAIIIVFIFFDKKLNKVINKLFSVNYKTWGKGAGSELISLKNLDELKIEGYYVIDDIQNKKGNVDIVCIGPTGIFVIEVKAHDGLISWSDKILRNEKPLNKDFIKQVHAESIFIKECLKERLNKEYIVQPILEFNNAKIQSSMYGKKKWCMDRWSQFCEVGYKK